MPSSSLERRLYLPCSSAVFFDLVADVEQYPRFVPGWREVHVVEREAGRLLVDQVVSMAGAAWRFRTEARLDRPKKIRISSVDAPFGALDIAWSFESLGDEGCVVVFRAGYDLGHAVLQRVASGFVERRLLQVMSAFEARTRGNCGNRGGAEPG